MIDDAYVARLRTRIEALEAELSRPETGAQQQKYRALVSERRHLKDLQGKAETFVRLTREQAEAKALAEVIGGDPGLRELARAELTELEQALPAARRALEIALLPPDPDDSRNTIMELRAGTGGDEAALFAGDLFRMYSRYCEARGWKFSVIDVSPGEAGGYKEVVVEIEGEIRPEDLRIDLFRASGAGGQKVNKTESAVRITHLPTNIVVQCQDERSQHRNKDKAMKVLTARLLDRIRQEEKAKQASDRHNVLSDGGRSDRIRTYNFPQNRVTDHRINLTLYNLDRVIEGSLDSLLDALYERDVEERLRQHLAPGTL